MVLRKVRATYTIFYRNYFTSSTLTWRKINYNYDLSEKVKLQDKVDVYRTIILYEELDSCCLVSLYIDRSCHNSIERKHNTGRSPN